MIGTVERTENEALKDIAVIRSDNWELPVLNLGYGKYEWRPRTAYLPYFLLEGEEMSHRTHGISLDKDQIIGIHGPRGSTKTLTNSFLVAKKMRMGQPAWCNWPISFYVMEDTCYDKCDIKREYYCPFCKHGDLSYYENYPLDFDKLYTFNSELSGGVAGLTETTYYAESRTSGRGQNRVLSYQLMQIRKSALSFFYDAQDPETVDKRFAWQDDLKIYCADLSRMNYDEAEVGHELEEGELSHWKVRDISGICTGEQYKNTLIEYGPYQFDGYNFFHIFPTRWKIDVFEAINSMKQDTAMADKAAKLGNAVSAAINAFLDENTTKVMVRELAQRATILGNITISPNMLGTVLSAYKVPIKQDRSGANKGKYFYDISQFLNNDGGAEVK